MDDLISRQAAIDAINHICPIDTDCDGTLLDRLDVRYVLSDLPSAQPEQKWIPCSERLPEANEDGESDYILLSCSNCSLPIIGRYQVDDQGGAFYDGDDDKPLVSYGLFTNAWMPLPESYKEGQE